MPKLAKFAIATIAFTRHGHGWAREGKGEGDREGTAGVVV